MLYKNYIKKYFTCGYTERDLRSSIRESFRSSPKPIFESRSVYIQIKKSSIEVRGRWGILLFCVRARGSICGQTRSSADEVWPKVF